MAEFWMGYLSGLVWVGVLRWAFGTEEGWVRTIPIHPPPDDQEDNDG